jgi:RpiR family carbohydrate utilization transcriptional regulator
MEKNFHIYLIFYYFGKNFLIIMSDFVQHLQANYSTLRKSEKKIADYLQQHAQERLDLSITELARRLKVSETTVSRFCRVIGLQGFQDLKLSMAASLNTVDEFKNIPPTIHEGDATPEIGRKLSESLSGSIAKTQQSLNVEDMDNAIDAIAHAKQILIYGIGGSAIIAHAAHHLFTKAGLNCVIYTDGYMQTVSASMLKPKMVALAVSNAGITKHVVDAVKIAVEKGAITIAMTSDRESALARASKICLATPLEYKDTPLYGGAIDAKVCQLYLVDLLYLGVLFKLGKPLKRNLKATADALRTYYNPIGMQL